MPRAVDGTPQRRALLASTAFTGVFVAIIAGHPHSALAACTVTVAPNSVTCTDTVTIWSSTIDGVPTNPGQDGGVGFSIGGDVSVSIAAGQTVSGYGLAVDTNQTGAGISIVNAGAVTASKFGAALYLLASGSGGIVYSGNGSVTNTGGDAVNLFGRDGDVVVGTSGTPVTPAFSGRQTLVIGTDAGSQIVNLTGGTATVTIPGGVGIFLSSLTGSISATLTGNTAITKASGLNAYGIVADSSGGAVAVSSDANIGMVGPANAFDVGINTFASGSGNITVNQTGGTIFATLNGIFSSHSGTGSTTVTTAAGSVITMTNTGDAAITVYGGAAGNVTVLHGGAIMGGSVGVQAEIFSAASTGDLTITSTGTIAAANIGISAMRSGTGLLTVNVANDVTSGGTGVRTVSSASGPSSVHITGGTVRGTVVGLDLGSGTGPIDVAIGAGATVSSSGVAVRLGGGTANTVANSGTITGGTGLQSFMGGATTITNAGSITGTGGTAVQLTGGSNVFVMSGPNARLTGRAIGSASDTFRFAGSGSNAFDVGQISTGWTLIDKTGSSDWTLTGTSTTTAAVTVNSGTLSVNGTITSTSGVTVNAGGTLGGTGTVGSTIINAGGTLAPGNSIGTITVSGNLSFVGAGNYVVEVSPTDADRTNVTGNAALSGTLRAVGTGGSYTVGQKYTVLNAAVGRNDTFGSLAISGNFGVTRPHVEYDGYNVYLVLDPNSAAALLVNGTPNQRAVAKAVDTAIIGGSTAAPFAALFGLTGAQLNRGLDQLSGEVHASTVGMLANDSLWMRGAILGRLRQASYVGAGEMASMAALSLGGPQAAFADGMMESALAYAKSPASSSPFVTKAPNSTPRPTGDTVFWAQGFGAWGRFEGDGNATSVRRDLAGFITGVDTRVANSGRLGIAAGYTGAKASSLGTANVDTAHIAGYGGWAFGAINLRAGGAYAFHSIDTDRMVNVPGFADRLMSRYDGSTGQVFGEVGYGVAMGSIALEPFAGAAWVRVHTDGTAERGGLAALNVAAQTFETGYSTLGVRAASIVPLANDMILIPRATVAWQHAFNDVTPNATMAFQVAPANAFAISGVPIARDSLLAEAGLDLAIGRTITVGLSYVGQVGNAVTDHAAKGKFSWAF